MITIKEKLRPPVFIIFVVPVIPEVALFFVFFYSFSNTFIKNGVPYSVKLTITSHSQHFER